MTMTNEGLPAAEQLHEAMQLARHDGRPFRQGRAALAAITPAVEKLTEQLDEAVRLLEQWDDEDRWAADLREGTRDFRALYQGAERTESVDRTEAGSR